MTVWESGLRTFTSANIVRTSALVCLRHSSRPVLRPDMASDVCHNATIFLHVWYGIHYPYLSFRFTNCAKSHSVTEIIFLAVIIKARRFAVHGTQRTVYWKGQAGEMKGIDSGVQ